MTHVRNRRRRNIKRGFLSAAAGRRMDRADAYRLFWQTTEPRRQDERNHAALMAARDADDARRARNGLKPRDPFWQRLGAVGR